MARNYLQGRYTLKNPSKYKGNSPDNIQFRSSWELKFMNYCDTNSNVIAWNSEETIIRYRSPKDDMIHRYFVDFTMKVRDNAGNTKTYLVEIKPYKQTVAPVPPKKKTKSFLLECVTYSVNQAKWAAARTFCDKHGIEFLILDEYALGIVKDNR